jgi:hypothetical protein
MRSFSEPTRTSAVLYSFLILAITEISALNEPLVNPYSMKTVTEPTPITPQEPATLALAITGFVAVAAYLGLRRVLRPQRTPKRLTLRTRRTDLDPVDRPTRRAA